LEQVHRSRQNGIRGLGQVMKSFRDRQVQFSVYDAEKFDTRYLETLGPLTRPRRPAMPVSNVTPLPTAAA
jgi:deaminated glutathione amidase